MTVEQMADDDYFAFDAVDQTALKKYLVSPLAYSQYLTGEHSSSPPVRVREGGSQSHIGQWPRGAGETEPTHQGRQSQVCGDIETA